MLLSIGWLVAPDEVDATGGESGDSSALRSRSSSLYNSTYEHLTVKSVPSSSRRLNSV